MCYFLTIIDHKYFRYVISNEIKTKHMFHPDLIMMIRWSINSLIIIKTRLGTHCAIIWVAVIIYHTHMYIRSLLLYTELNYFTQEAMQAARWPSRQFQAACTGYEWVNNITKREFVCILYRTWFRYALYRFVDLNLYIRNLGKSSDVARGWRCCYITYIKSK